MATSGPLLLPRPSLLGRTLRAHPHFGPVEERLEPALEPLLLPADSRHLISHVARVDVAKQRRGLWESSGLDLTSCVVHERDRHLVASGLVLLHTRFARSKDVTEYEVVDEREEREPSWTVQ